MYLKEIIDHKREEIKTMKPADKNRYRPVKNPLDYLTDRPFIAEIKKASPSHGDIKRGVDIKGQGRLYEQGGAGAVSVLTESRYFHGSFDYLTELSSSVNLPLLCKDFILSEVQIDNAYMYGADFILLIASILNVRELRILSARAGRYSMKILYELHERDEFEKIKNLDPELVGVNSRDLKSFSINKKKAMETISALNGDFLKIAESGIETQDDIRNFKRAGADAFLIGTALMTADNPMDMLKKFYSALETTCL
jgi:indole-3-glycerol phosphate synthase